MGLEATRLHEVVGKKDPVPAKGVVFTSALGSTFTDRGFASLYGDKV